jgi:hypothetical protein
MGSRAGYGHEICAKVDIKVPGHNHVLTRRQQREDLVGRRQSVSGIDTSSGWPSSDMQAAQQAGAAY